jgi:hypothetical protein
VFSFEPFGNWYNSFNEAVKEIISTFTKSNRTFLERLDKLELILMATLEDLKLAIADNAAKTQELGDLIIAEALEVKAVIEKLESVAPIDALGLAEEIAKLKASTDKLSGYGVSISEIVVPEVDPVEPVEPPVE